jgi:hypothetical protein
MSLPTTPSHVSKMTHAGISIVLARSGDHRACMFALVDDRRFALDRPDCGDDWG